MTAARFSATARKTGCRSFALTSLLGLAVLGFGCGGGDGDRAAPPGAEPAADTDSAGPIRLGFSVAGPDWRQPETAGLASPQRVFDATRQIGRDDAALTLRAGGRMLRVPFSPSTVLGAAYQRLFVQRDLPSRLTVDERLAALDALAAGLRRAVETLPAGQTITGEPLAWGLWDAYVGGVEDFNRSLDDTRSRMEVLIVIAEPAPAMILESLSDSTLQAQRRAYTFETLWQDYTLVQLGLARQLVRRFVTQSGTLRGVEGHQAVTAIEILNEPDVFWLPAELRAVDAQAFPIHPAGQYVTAPNNPQIPISEEFNRSIELVPWGVRDQDIQLDDVETPVPVLTFRWGRKFDRYVVQAAKLIKQLSFAVRDEAGRAGAPLAIVSGSVTHVNIDYLVRLYRADPEVFRYVDKVGIHPYHWPEHDIWRTDFISRTPTEHWPHADPRHYAWLLYKRFDFIEELRHITRIPDPGSSFGLFGKAIWVTEFGVPTKKIGRANQGLDNLPLFIYERGEAVPRTVRAIVWEDKWDAFLSQVDRSYLDDNGVEVFLIYTLREGLQSATSDDDHSNYALYTRDGTPRMARATHNGLLQFFQSLSSAR